MDQIPYNRDADKRKASGRPIPEWLDDESIEEFMRIYEEDFGDRLTDGEARLMATRLLELYELLYSSDRPSSDNDENSLIRP